MGYRWTGRIATLAVLLAVGVGGAAQASQCGDQITVLDQAYGLGETSPGAAATAPQTGTMPNRGPASAVNTVPNTGGVAPSGGALSPTDRERLRQALAAARDADRAGDASQCAAHLVEARRVTAGHGQSEPPVGGNGP